MDMILDIVLLAVGFVLLIKGADYFVEGSSSVAKILKIPSIVVGLTIVALGTSLPELAVSLSAALSGSNEIAISNVVGSNIFNVAVVLGGCALLAPVPVDKSIMKRDFPFAIIITAVLIFFFADAFKFWGNFEMEGFIGELSRINGVILLVLFIGYLTVTVKSALKNRKDEKEKEKEEDEDDEEKPRSIWVSIVFIVCGIIAIKFGGDFVVDSASSIATAIGMSETLVGLTIVAIGTSLPEFVTSIVAARKGETGLAVGNVIGSNIFNILFILGVSCTISPIMVTAENMVDIIIVLAISIIAMIFGKSRDTIEKKEGLIMLGMYILYMAYAIIR